MGNDSSVLTALLGALDSSPNDIQLLTHVGDLLIQDDRHKEAITYFQRVLAQNPVHPDALRGALLCSKNIGDADLSSGYQKLVNSLNLDVESATVSDKPEVENHPAESISPDRKRGAVLKLVKSGEEAEAWVDVEDSNVYLKDVGGLENVKKRLQLAFLGPLQNPDIVKAYGKSLGGGLLLYGPPGCGKTFIARALAGELGAKFISIGIADVMDMYMGESERKLHEIFASARRNTPAVLFFDELDALGQKRSQLRNSAMRSTVNQLLAEMDSMEGSNDNLFILGATNHPWDIDSALRRPGRFDRIVAVFPPDGEARKTILSHYLSSKPTEAIDVDSLVKATREFSGADLRYLCDCAAEQAIEDSLATGEVRPLAQTDFATPLKEIRPSTRVWFETARNFAMFANETGAYDDLLEYIREHRL